MKKLKMKVLSTALVLLSAVVISINVGISNQKNQLLSLLSMDNIEALADESDEYCFFYREECDFEIETNEQAVMIYNYMIRIVRDFPKLSIGMTLDFVDLTGVVSPIPPWGGCKVIKCDDIESMPCARLLDIIFNP